MVIKDKRKEIGLTQEQIGEYLGVSTPTVNKWESGATYPDITLLPALARLLKTDVNTLLCFNEGLSEQEISHFCKEVIDTIRKSGFESGITMVVEKVREYPNCGLLIHTTAMTLDGALMMSGMSPYDKGKYGHQITVLYERAAKCDDEQIRNRAIYILASKYTVLGQYDNAQEMLNSLPESTAVDKEQLQANLWIRQGHLTQAAQLLERKLYMTGILELQMILTNLAIIAVKEGSDQEASHIAQVAREIAGLFGLWDYYAYIVPLQIALTKEDAAASVSLIKSMLEAAFTPWQMNESPLYRHFALKANFSSSGTQILPGLLSELENDSKYAFLNSNAEFQQLMEQYRAKC